LGAHDLLVFNAGSHRLGWRLWRDGEERRVDLDGRLRVNNSFAVRDAARAGLGIAQLPEVVAAEALRTGELQAVLPDWRPAPVPVHALFPSTRYLTPKVRAFIDHAVAEFNAPPALRTSSGTAT
jgi:LysR family transcriptional regulator for bpeEF and oprC